MTTFLLVHGAFRGGWAWDDVRPLLEEHGHRVLAPSLLGCGELAGHPALTLDVWVDQLAALLEDEQAREVVAVGHSMGGVPVTALAALHPEPLSLVAYLDAPAPRPGQRAVGLGVPPVDLPARESVLDPPAGDPRLGPTPVGPSLDPMPAPARGVSAPPRAYAFCAHTPPGYPCASTRADLDAAATPYTLLDCDHDAPLAAPWLVAQWLLTQVREVAA